MTSEILERGGLLAPQERSEQAWRAVRAFRALQPTLTSYARMLTGNKTVLVVPATQDNGSTDGQKIYLRPPIALGDMTPHQPSVCDRRDETGIQVCPACMIREAVLVTIYHEIAHIAFESFARTSDDAKAKAIEFALREASLYNSAWAKRVEQRIKTAPKYMTQQYMPLASLVNQFLPIMVNCVEDARVNRELFKIRAGLKKMFEADEKKIFEKGFEAADAYGNVTTKYWREAPLNSQVMVGTFAKCVGYKYDAWFHPKVVEALDDLQISKMVTELDTIKSIGQVYNLSLRLMARYRDLGFFETPEDSDPEPESGEEDAEQDDSESGDSEEPSEDGESDDSMAGDESDSDAESEGSGGGSSGPEDDESSDSEADGSADERSDGDADAGDSSDDSAGSGDLSESVSEGHDPVDSEGSSEPDSAGESEGEAGTPADSTSPDDDEPIDTGADDGYGGTSVIDSGEPTPEMGTPEEVEPILQEWNQHEEKPKTVAAQQAEEAVDVAIIQGIYFTTPSSTVSGVEFHSHYPATGWDGRRGSRRDGTITDLVVPEAILQPSILHTRRAFTDNQRAKHDRDRKSGRVNARVLGRRAWNNDERLFAKKSVPGRKNYAVLIMVDISGSTTGVNLALEKRAVYAQAEMLNRVGVPFSIVAHTGDYEYTNYTLALQLYVVKEEKDPWNDRAKQRLSDLGPVAANLDGHALEYGVKLISKSQATDKVILYYSDGKMPAENHDEELEILIREIRYCRAKGIHLLGVGIRTDSPKAHGLDTVEVHTDEDLVKVVKHLGKVLKGLA